MRIMTPLIEPLLIRLDQLEEAARAIASLLIGRTEPFETAWDAANRICDRYCLPNFDPVRPNASGPNRLPH
jgi:hypothetical protein